MKTALSVYLILVLCLVKVSYGQDYIKLEREFENSTVLPNIYSGFSLFDLDQHKYVFGVKENQHFTPASNTKIFTLFSALKHIGDSIPGIQYVVRGDSLIFWGTGDPTFLHPKLDSRKVYNFLVNSKKTLYYVPQQPSEAEYRNGWSTEDFQADFQPDISTFPIYGNVIRFVSKANKLQAIPSYFDATLTKKETSGANFSIERKSHENAFEISNASPPANLKISKPFIWTDSLFAHLLQDTLQKKVALLENYEKPKDLKTIYSVPRNVVLREMMLPSDNFLAEHLTMVISMLKYDGFYTDKLRAYMQDEYYSNFQDSIVLRDGSGLSTYNKVSPRSVVELLVQLNDIVPDDNKRYLFFPAGGVDGTLKNTYSLDLEVPFVFAKTGTLNAVHCQSGYLVTRSGRRFAFSFLNNNFVIPTSAVRKEMVRLMTFIRQNY